MKSTLQTGATVYDGKGYKKYYSKNTINVVSHNKSMKSFNSKYSSWWDKECSDLIYKRKTSYKKFVNPSRNNLLEYKSISQFTRKELNKKKRSNFKNFINSLNLYNGPTKFWNTIKSFKNSHYFIDPNPISVISKQSSIDKFIFNLAEATSYMAECTLGKYPSFFNFKFNLLELKEMINSLSRNSSPEPDMINNYLLKLIPDLGLISLLEIFELILKSKFYPKFWKKFIIILLQKPSRVDFRLITLASCILKVLERLVKRRLEKYVEIDYLIPESQYGFRKGKSCDECLAILNLEIYNSFIKGEYVGAIFFDIKPAYDVYPPILFNIINDLKT